MREQIEACFDSHHGLVRINAIAIVQRVHRELRPIVDADFEHRDRFVNPTEQPGVVFLFQKNLERMCPDRPTLEDEIRITVWHELAHYLGFGEDEMEEMGLD